jgi:hypothetical protein
VQDALSDIQAAIQATAILEHPEYPQDAELPDNDQDSNWDSDNDEADPSSNLRAEIQKLKPQKWHVLCCSHKLN